MVIPSNTSISVSPPVNEAIAPVWSAGKVWDSFVRNPVTASVPAAPSTPEVPPSSLNILVVLLILTIITFIIFISGKSIGVLKAIILLSMYILFISYVIFYHV